MVRMSLNAAAAPIESLRDALARDGYAFVPAAAMKAALESRASLADWEAFAASWNDLPLDRYMADGGRYRRRRHACFSVMPGGDIERLPHQPHYQSRDYNPLNGGIARWFDPVDARVGGGPTMKAVLDLCSVLFGALAPAPRSWHVEMHQFRIEARQDEQGRPTPEGVHRDGVDFALVLLIRRHNVAQGTTTIHALDGSPLGSFTLTDAFDAALVDDARVCHGVTPVEPLDPAAPACRDVLVVTFKRT